MLDTVGKVSCKEDIVYDYIVNQRCSVSFAVVTAHLMSAFVISSFPECGQLHKGQEIKVIRIISAAGRSRARLAAKSC